MDSGSTAEWFGALATLAAVAVALYQANRGSRDLRAQLKHQAKLEHARIEEQHFNRALAVIRDGYDEALIFGSYLRSELGRQPKEPVEYDAATLERRHTSKERRPDFTWIVCAQYIRRCTPLRSSWVL